MSRERAGSNRKHSCVGVLFIHVCLSSRINVKGCERKWETGERESTRAEKSSQSSERFFILLLIHPLKDVEAALMMKGMNSTPASILREGQGIQRYRAWERDRERARLSLGLTCLQIWFPYPKTSITLSTLRWLKTILLPQINMHIPHWLKGTLTQTQTHTHSHTCLICHLGKEFQTLACQRWHSEFWYRLDFL